MPLFKHFALKVAGVGGASILLGKAYGLKKYREWRYGGSAHEPSIESASNNRALFARLPRRKQREVLYRKRAQIRDYENITYSGYGPRRRRRRLRAWGS